MTAALHNLPERRDFGLRRGRPYWVGRARRRNAVYATSLVFALVWMLFSLWLSLPWLADLSELTHPTLAITVLTFIAYIPGFMNAFLLASLVLRPSSLRADPPVWPGISILIAAYQEEEMISQTLRSLSELDYQGPLEVIVIDDGSQDNTFAVASSCQSLCEARDDFSLVPLRLAKNSGKAAALNFGLERPFTISSSLLMPILVWNRGRSRRLSRTFMPHRPRPPPLQEPCSSITPRRPSSQQLSNGIISTASRRLNGCRGCSIRPWSPKVHFRSIEKRR